VVALVLWGGYSLPLGSGSLGAVGAGGGFGK